MMKINIKNLAVKSLLMAAIVLFIFPSCNDDILDEKPLDFLSPDNAYLTEAGALQGITALHDRVRSAYYSFGEFGVMNWATHGSDLGYNGETPGPGGSYLNSYADMTPVWRNVIATWNVGFEIIQWANVLIDRVESADPEAFSDGEAGKSKYIAEARFFRGFAYRYLVSTYGDIPLLTEPINSAKADFIRNPVADIHDLMVEDFQFAANNLPKPGEEDAPGRITQGPAWHYLAETYLEQDDFQNAVDAASKVIEDYDYDLMQERFGTKLGNDVWGSGDVYFDLFGFGNHNLPENTEAMWVIQVEPFIIGGGQIASAYIFGPRYFDIGLTPDGKKGFQGELYNGLYTGYSDSLGRPTANGRGTSLVYYDIWKDNWDIDVRNAEHNLKRNFYFDNPESAFDKQKIDFSLYDPPRPDPIADTCKIIFPIHTKFTDPLNYFLQPNRSGGGITHKDWYALRFAETLLIRAEANLELGNNGLAAADVNRIRERANATPVSAAEIDMDFLLDERVRELYGEEWRLIILRRTGKLLERVRKYNDNPLVPGADIEEHNFRWPIPQEQIDLNVDADFPQNTGY
ncbi:RagB/SusD family nutrient uptake outer membrane protein [Cyclobacterium marinum]|uniref:RagB/SusD domain-containing protein n=1 Tax=Cyclobacterium marinum (strain ATCC 25205 / DSM 745 / LMG 13164 / NCIMB 1802) TaxID=880070 RepID=G0IYY9_CYCMS|nr:RagB/SusD family nutrient uptake outer membrane protein [Cyclobacterium marinum]AEL28134.1 RagB/SusD domain-containing protein [Cyclobacterium marinum DSM 745]MBI0397901.1 RagB/SusD family nutrient uptake outer membrane protein [Cyclobacterium marinum]|tara:strand:- start:121670 stop:123388 length:1719 start_codon:yes stop_codon:yes gene_type:complete